MKALHLCVTFLWVTLICCFQQCNFPFLPMPRLCNITQDRNPVLLNPCSLIFDIQGTIIQPQSFQEVISQYSKTVYKCKDTVPLVLFNQNNNISATYVNPYVVHIKVNDSTVKSVFTADQQSYTLSISKIETSITAVTYVGFIRAIETFSQAFNCSRSRIDTPCALTNLPIYIQDKPQYPFRGLMIDPARHFIPLPLILQTVDTMMYSKLNVLHIHFTDEDSFPILLDKHPEIAEHAAFSKQQVYTIPDLKELVRYSMVRGVRVIPQIDTPGHASTWGYSPQNKDVACVNYPKSLFRGSLDVTMDATYQLLRDVLQEIVQIFVDPVIHLGGDELILTCLQNISYFEDMNNEQLQIMYRKKQKKILYELNPKKKPMFWVRNEANETYFPSQQDEIIHWWGFQQKRLPQMFPKNKFVMSYYGKHYLNMGTGNNKAVSYWNFSTWYDVYGVDIGKQHFDYPYPQNILGAEMTLWGQVTNVYTHHLKIWVKNAAFAEKIWNPHVSNVIPGVMKRMIAFERLLNKRGIITTPITTRMCEQNLHRCVDMS